MVLQLKKHMQNNDYYLIGCTTRIEYIKKETLCVYTASNSYLFLR
jgi:hypothetical protein